MANHKPTDNSDKLEAYVVWICVLSPFLICFILLICIFGCIFGWKPTLLAFFCCKCGLLCDDLDTPIEDKNDDHNDEKEKLEAEKREMEAIDRKEKEEAKNEENQYLQQL